MADFHQLEWLVYRSGYQWVDMGDERKLTSVANPIVRDCEYYLPFKHTGLFQKFGALDITEQAIIEFANRYGRLSNATEGDGFKSWENSIIAMRDAVSLWTAIEKRNTRYLKKIIIWKDNIVMCQFDWHEITFRQNVTSRFKKNDLIEPALFYLGNIVNKRLKGAVSPCLLWAGEHLGEYLQPDTLVSGLWLQFERAVSGNKKYQRCITCNDLFELAPGVKRKDSKYCSDACRSAAYRKRKEQTK